MKLLYVLVTALVTISCGGTPTVETHEHPVDAGIDSSVTGTACDAPSSEAEACGFVGICGYRGYHVHTCINSKWSAWGACLAYTNCDAGTGNDSHATSVPDAGADASHLNDAAGDTHDAGHDVGVDSWTAPITSGSVVTGGKCTALADCTIGSCDYTGHCIPYISCSQHHGGDTCGAGEDTDLGVNATPATGEESCCTTINIPGTSYIVDKYLVTSGRMRAMVTALNGNLRAFTASIPASNQYWNPAWNAYIPSTLDEVDEQLGPYPAPLSPDPYNPDDEVLDTADNLPLGLGMGQWRDGCTQGSPGKPDGARTWWSNKTMGGDQAPVVYPQDFLDDKMLNCVDSYLLTAFCIWDGGHLTSLDELAAAWGPGRFPWSAVAPDVGINLICSLENSYGNCLDTSFQEPQGSDANGLDMSSYVVHEFGGVNFEFKNPFTYNYDPYGLQADLTYHIGAPGRFPLGQGPYGHMDLAGESYPIAMIQPGLNPSDVTSIANVEHIGTMAGTGSFEIHPIEPGSGSNQKDSLFRPAWWAYYAMGGRCAR